MNSWRILILILVLIAVGLLVAAAIYGWTPWKAGTQLRSTFPGQRLSATLPQPPSALSLSGALLTLFLNGVMLLFLFPRRIGRVASTFGKSWKTLLRLGLLGLLVGVLVAMAGIGSSLTMMTFPLTFFLGMIFFLCALFGLIALAFQLGRILLVKAGWPQASPLVALFLGELILFPFSNIPGVGLAVIFILMSLGLGGTIATRFGSDSPWSLISLTEEGNK